MFRKSVVDSAVTLRISMDEAPWDDVAYLGDCELELEALNLSGRESVVVDSLVKAYHGLEGISDQAAPLYAGFEIDLYLLSSDLPSNPERYYDYVLYWLSLGEEVSVSQMYLTSTCPWYHEGWGEIADIPPYLTLHDLVCEGKIVGVSPYETKASGLNHQGLIYTLAG